IQIKTAVVLAGMGVFLFIATGVVSMFNSGNFLEFHALPFTLNMSDASRHTLGMTIIEIGIAICVAATIIVIFTALQRGRKD
ncbi:MAG: hypothetical protein FWD00_05270, partial [Clostridiales bacterium]|nr:hypothetical protein [Clostridiales bacterium]